MLAPRYLRRQELFTAFQSLAAASQLPCAALVQLQPALPYTGPPLTVPLSQPPMAVLKSLAAATGPSAYGPREDPVVAARVGGVLCGLRDPLASVVAASTSTAAAAPLSLEFVHFSSQLGKSVYWHSGAHVLGAALEATYGEGLHLLDGPPVLEGEGGFFYDAALPGGRTLSEEAHAPLEAAARAVAALKAPFERLPLSRAQAQQLFQDSPFKLALLERIPASEPLTAYRCGPFVDLCKGPHLPHTGLLAALRVHKSSGSQGGQDAALAQRQGLALQRAYAVAFPTPPQLAQWGVRLEEARQRDHRLIGKAQALFFFHDLSPGSAFMLPHGTRILNRLTALLRTEYRRRGYQEVASPLLFKKQLWHTSGHLQAYAENMYSAVPGGLVPSSAAHQGHSCSSSSSSSSEQEEGEEGLYGLKPMNCPGHCLIFAQRLVTYRDLPLRLADFSALHRNEVSGSLGGLTRLRRFSQDDAHIFCTEAQVGQEVAGVLDFVAAIYSLFGFTFRAVLSTRPAEGSVGDDATWQAAEAALGQALAGFLERGARGAGGEAAAAAASLQVDAGGGAFYGPKIDVFVKDALGREHQCATVQLDFNLPRRFGLTYRTSGGVAGEEGKGSSEAAAAAVAAAADAATPAAAPATTAVPVMIHRAVLGSLERFMGILIEHTAGKWPFWLSPRQVLLCTVSERHQAYAERVAEALRFPVVVPGGEGEAAAAAAVPGAAPGPAAEPLVEDSTLWVDIDASARTVNKKVREGQSEAFNLLVLLGDEEEKAESASVRFRDQGSLAAFEVCLREVGEGQGTAWKHKGVGSGTWAWAPGEGGKGGKAADRPASAAAAAAAAAAAPFASPLVTLPVSTLVKVCQRMQLRKL